jgi:hypothetical protein
LTGAIRGARLPAEVKLALVGAITEAKAAGFPIVRACEVLMLQPRRFHRWLKGRDPKSITAEDVSDEPPVAKTIPHQITADERAAIIDAARDEANSDKAHRKLAHHLSRTAKAFVSESTVLRVLRSVAPRVPLPGARRAAQVGQARDRRRNPQRDLGVGHLLLPRR